MAKSNRPKEQKSYEVVNHTEGVRYRYLLKSDIDHFKETKWKGHDLTVTRKPVNLRS